MSRLAYGRITIAQLYYFYLGHNSISSLQNRLGLNNDLPQVIASGRSFDIFLFQMTHIHFIIPFTCVGVANTSGFRFDA